MSLRSLNEKKIETSEACQRSVSDYVQNIAEVCEGVCIG